MDKITFCTKKKKKIPVIIHYLEMLNTCVECNCVAYVFFQEHTQ